MSLSTYFLEYGRHVARLCRRAYAPTSNTPSHDNHEKILHGFSFLSHDDYGAPLGGPLGRQSSTKNITVDKKSLFWKSWFDRGIYFIGDLLNSAGKFLTLDEFQNKFDFKSVTFS